MKRKTHKKPRRKNRNHVVRRKIKSCCVKAPTTARQYFLLSPSNQETWDSIGHVVSRIREGVTLPKAAREFGLAPKTVITLGRSALRKQK
ncbi:MAG TPA: hypothetical protein VFQ43_03035, partial [Nitrososphaera sp.]|nr:hypothetical protein [Nitrososphaera sp.]